MLNKIFRHSRLLVVIIALLTVLFAFQIPDININNDIKVFLPEDNPAKKTNRRIEDIFGNNEEMVVAVDIKYGTVFEKENIRLINKITEDLSKVSGTEEVTSFTNVDYIEGTAQGMEVSELVQQLPQEERDVHNIKQKLLSWDFYRNNLYSDDFKTTQILITLKKGVDTDRKSVIYQKINQVLNNYNQEQLQFYVAGTTSINVQMGNKMLEDIKKLIPVVFIIILISLYLFFRRIEAVVLTIMTVIISSIWSVGLMAWLGINMTLVSTVIPVLLIAVGSAYGIHILSHYYDGIRNRGRINKEEHRELVLDVVSRIGKPVFLAGITTVAGFGSLATSRIVPIKNFGIFTALGIISAFMVAIFLIPALLLLTYEADTSKNKEKLGNNFDKLFKSLHNRYRKNRFIIMVIVLIIAAVSIGGITKVVTDFSLIEMFKEDTEIRKADNFINNHFSGTYLLNVLIEGENRGSLTDPEILKSMDNLQNYLMNNYSFVGKAVSFTDFLKRMNQVMNHPGEQEPSSEPIPKTGGSFEEEETTSEFGEETTSDFGKENTSDFNEETTSNFGSNSETSTSTKSTSSSEDKQEKDFELTRPDSQNKITEKDLVAILNKVRADAHKYDLSAEELIELVNEEFNYQGAAYYEVPYNPQKYPVTDKQDLKNLVSQYLLLYSGSLDDLINDQLEPSQAQIMVQMNNSSNQKAAQIKNEILEYKENNFPEDYELTVSGTANMSLAANDLIISSQTRSIITSFIIVFLIVAFSFNSITAGFYGVIPLAFSLLINFALMGYTGIKLDVGIAMVASVAIGIGVDYAIHFLSAYHHERQQSEDLVLVTRRTLKSSGKAIIFNAVSVAAGFLVLLFSNFYPLVYLGLLIAVTMLTSSLASLTILPILLNIFKPNFMSKEVK